MLNYKIGDLLSDNAEALVNTVNCVGVMGRGIALQFKKKFSDNYIAYEAKCKRNEIMPGKLFVFETNCLLNPKYIINFPTKRHWKGASKIEDIEAGLSALVCTIKDYNIKSIAIPPLGCGLGGLDWNVVQKKLEHYLGGLEDVQINIYKPHGAPLAEDMVKNIKVPKMTAPRAALIKLIDAYNLGGLSPLITLKELHKLLYFLQNSGEMLRLDFVKEQYGPYAKNLAHVLNRLEGHMIYGYADGGNNPNKQLKLIPGATEDATEFLTAYADTCSRIQRVSQLVEGFETPFGMELLATVHWVAQEDSCLPRVIEQVYAWNKHKEQFTKRQIQIALDRLKEQSWV